MNRQIRSKMTLKWNGWGSRLFTQKGFKKKGESEPWDWKKEYSLIRQTAGWAENVKKQERKWCSLHFLFTTGPITPPPPMHLTEHLSCSLQVPLKRLYILQRLQSITTQKTTVLTILTMRTELKTQFICNTPHSFDTSEENILIIVQARHFLVQRIVSKQTDANVPN
jgi:hypothetical protein